jgi:hypothetical protein
VTFQIDLYRVILIAAVAAILCLQVYRAFVATSDKPSRRPVIIFGCRHRAGQYNDKAGDTFVLGVIAVGVTCCVAFSIYLNRAGEASAFTAVLMAIIGAIKESRLQRSSERTIQQITPTSGQGGQS